MRKARLARNRQGSPVSSKLWVTRKPLIAKKNKDADEAKDRLVAGQPDQPLVVLRALGDQEGMREDNRGGGDQTQRVEIILSLHGMPPRLTALFDNDRTGEINPVVVF